MSFGMQSMDYVSTNILGKFVGGKNGCITSLWIF